MDDCVVFDSDRFGEAVTGRLVYMRQTAGHIGECCRRGLARVEALRTLFATKPFWDDLNAVFKELGAINSMRVHIENAYASAQKYIDSDEGYLKEDEE